MTFIVKTKDILHYSELADFDIMVSPVIEGGDAPH